MADTRNCPKCGANLPANAPAGICPKCLIQVGLDQSEPAVDSGKASAAATTPPAGAFTPPQPHELEPHFPQLDAIELLGHGGMGAVYKARQTKLDRYVAVKIIRPESAADPSFAERFNREARTLAKLDHANIVSVHDFGEIRLGESEGSLPVYYFIMEFVDGANLRQVLVSGGLTAERALTIVPQICEALQFAHDEGIVHRDIKPENILVDTRGRVKIADFGLAKIGSDESVDYTLTGTHQVMGTPRYMAPEQMVGAREVDHRADIYSLGVVLYEMLTGELPLGRFDPPSRMVSVDTQWDEVVMRALEKEPGRRFQQASEVKSEVERVSDPGLATPPAPSSPASPVDRRVLPTQLASMPHYGLLMMGGVMLTLGITLIFLQSSVLATSAFTWIGVGLALGGGGLFTKAFDNSSKLPAGTQPNPGLLLQGAVMVAVGVALMAFCFVQNGESINVHLGNPLLWTGIGVILGGGGCFVGAWNKGDTALDTPVPLSSPQVAEAKPPVRKPAAEQVRVPSTLLLLSGALNCLCIVPWSALIYFGTANQRVLGGQEEAVCIWLFSCSAVGLLVAFGAFKMLQLTAYRISMVATILAIVPFTPGALIGIPAGIWALVVLTRPGIRESFL